MYETTTYCGIECSLCPAFKATQENDMKKLAEVAAEWSKHFGMDVTAENVLCDGCKSDTGRICGYCGACLVRSCGIEKGVVTCAHCEDYSCEKLENCPGFMVHGKTKLDKIKAEL